MITINETALSAAALAVAFADFDGKTPKETARDAITAYLSAIPAPEGEYAGLVKELRVNMHAYGICQKAADAIEALSARTIAAERKRDKTRKYFERALNKAINNGREAVAQRERAEAAEDHVTTLREILHEARWHFANNEKIAIKIDAALAQSQPARGKE